MKFIRFVKKNWNGIKNGELLKLMLAEKFHALLTFDKNLQHQQNFEKYTLTVFVFNAKDNTRLELTKLTDKINKILREENLPLGPIIIS